MAHHTIIRRYEGEGASELFDLIEERADDVRERISSVPGFVSYTAFRADGGGTTVTVCEDKAGTDESSTRAAAWVSENASFAVASPAVTEGDSMMEF
jgi:hypothetical protein